MASDTDIRNDVEEELRSDPDIKATDIAVSVANRVVTLTGFVRSYTQKLDAEADAKHVRGVLGVANDIEVRIPEVDQRPDPVIARDAVSALRHALPYVADYVTTTVTDGWVMLEGLLDWHHQRERAEAVVRGVQGVKGLTNSIKVMFHPAESDVKQRIEEAFRRSAAIDAAQLRVEIEGDDIVLEGVVRSWTEREQAERTAWRTPGVRRVENKIVIAV